MTDLNLPSPAEMMRQNQELKKRFEATAESISLQAKLLRSAYESLLDTGFTPLEALEIVKARGWGLS